MRRRRGFPFSSIVDSRWWVRGVRGGATVVVVALVLSVFFPSGQVVPGGRFPTSWLESLLPGRSAWAADPWSAALPLAGLLGIRAGSHTVPAAATKGKGGA